MADLNNKKAIIEKKVKVCRIGGYSKSGRIFFLQSGHIFRSKECTLFRLKVCSRLILSPFKTLTVSSGPSFTNHTENKPWLIWSLKTVGLFCFKLTYIYDYDLRLLWMRIPGFCRAKAFWGNLPDPWSGSLMFFQMEMY